MLETAPWQCLHQVSPVLCNQVAAGSHRKIENMPFASPGQGVGLNGNSFISLQRAKHKSEGEMTTLTLDISSLMAPFFPHRTKSPFYTSQLSGPGPA